MAPERTARSSEIRPLLVTYKQAQALTGFGESTFYRATQRGELPVVRLGRSVRIALSDLEQWIEAHRDTAA